MQSKTTKELSYISILAGVIGFFLILLELYYSNYFLITKLGWNIPLLDDMLAKGGFSFLQNKLVVRTIVVACFAFFIIYPSVAERKKSIWRTITSILISCGLLYALLLLYAMPYPNYIGQAINLLCTPVLSVVLIRQFYRLSAFFSTTRSLGNNEMYASGFQQNTKLIETPVSVNLKYYFTYKSRQIQGWINIVNPYRATSILGLPGSGKSYATLEEYIRQMLFKHFSAVIYDYKDPALTLLAYNYLQQLKRQPKGKNPVPEFIYISFKDLNRTMRCNPLKGITTQAEALDFANVMLIALNKKFAEQQGEFFTESAKNFTAMNIYTLSMVNQGKYLSLPHLLSFVSQDVETSFPCFKFLSIFYPDLKKLFNPFEGAYSKQVWEQLQGQLSSAQIGMGSLSDREMAWVMTEDPDHPEWNAPIDVNSKTSPLVFCIGNDPNKDTVTGMANSVYLSKLAKSVNKKGTPCLFAVDELPTVFIKGLDNLIATARSNYIAVVLGFQDLSQLIRDYGDKPGKVIWNTTGNVFSGAVKGETAQNLSKSFGDKKVLKESKTINANGEVSISLQESKEARIPVDVIEELSQGEFVGRAVDNFGDHNKYKTFHGTIQIDEKVKETPLEIPKLRDLSLEEISLMTQLNQIRIENEISDVIGEIKDLTTDYETLKAWTFKPAKKEQEEQQLVCLEKFIENPQDPQLQKQFFLWLEQAYVIVVNLQVLELKNDVLPFEEKFELLLRDVYNSTADNIRKAQQYRKSLNAETLDQVQAINRANETLQETEEQDPSQYFDNFEN